MNCLAPGKTTLPTLPTLPLGLAPRRSKAVSYLAALAALAAATLVGCTGERPAAPEAKAEAAAPVSAAEDVWFGTLMSNPANIARNVEAGITHATVAVHWSRAEPEPGRFSTDYFAAMRDFDEPYGPDEADSAVQPCTWMFISQRLRPGARMPGKLLGGFVESNYTWVGNAADPDFIARQAGAYLHWGVTVRCDDTRDPAAVARAQRAAFVKFEPELAVFQERGFAIHLAPRIGIRESRRVLGEPAVMIEEKRTPCPFPHRPASAA